MPAPLFVFGLHRRRVEPEIKLRFPFNFDAVAL
jgi:hypothetical protein